MTARRALGLAVASALLQACGGPSAGPPRAQVLLHVDTDAPVVAVSPSTPDPWATPIALFDRLRVDAYPPGASAPCEGCSNEFSVGDEQFTSSRVSVGVAVGAGVAGWIARVRLTVQRFETISGDLDPDTTLDTYLALPPVADGEVTDVSVVLSTDSVGVSMGSLASPVAPTLGPPSATLVGSWPDAQRTTCSTSAPPGAACVPGGAFWMGVSNDHIVDGAAPGWRRLVVVSPFWIDQTEVTVGVARERNLFDPDVWTGNTIGADQMDWCTYTTGGPTPRDPLPVECISWVEGRVYCGGLHGTFPSEAQIGYLAGGASGTPYPWGHDPPSCTDAIWGRNGYGYFNLNSPTVCLAPTNFLAPLGGPEPPGHGARDVVVVPGGGRIVDLAGNVGEYLLDAFELRDGPCWSTPGILRDPVCKEATDPPDPITILEGSWGSGTGQLEVEARNPAPPRTFDPTVGLRCAYAGR